MMTGKIIKGIGGFYYVKSEQGEIYECKARGIFRKSGISPLVGDDVECTVNSGAQNTVDRILPRKNFLIRPPVANVDNLVIISSVSDPLPNLYLIDRMTVIAQYNGITPVIVFNKTDTADAGELMRIYESVGYRCFAVCAKTSEGIDEFKEIFAGRLSVLTGNSGVGKSSILNCIDPELELPTGETSKKLGRGRHTTRSAQLFELYGGLVADTAGFSAVDMERMQFISKEKLPYCFPEFSDYLGRCKFVSCSHTKEKGCAVLKALEQEKIEKTRFESYIRLYELVKDVKEWQIKNN